MKTKHAPMDTEQKPDFYALGIDDWKNQFKALDESVWTNEIEGHAKTVAAGCEKIWTDYVTPLRSALQEIVSCQDDPEKSLANLNGAIRNAKSLLQKHQPNKVK
jgi:hypothetical protein